MNEAQAFNMALATVPTMVVVLVGILLNNARLTDVKEGIRAEIKVVEAQVKSQSSSLEALIDKNHSEMLHRFGDLDTRLTRIESSLGMSRG